MDNFRMKTRFFTVTAVLVAICAFWSIAFVGNADAKSFDVNNDQYEDINDVTFVLTYLANGGMDEIPNLQMDLDLDNQISIADVTALLVYLAIGEKPEMYSVTFRDTVTQEEIVQYVKPGASVGLPYKEGYRFACEAGNAALECINSDVVLEGCFIKQYMVRFEDYDGSLLSVSLVDDGGKAQAPTFPTRKGYRFKGWSDYFNNVCEDCTITAVYDRVYDITFLDYDGRMISRQEDVIKDEIVTPSSPQRNEYLFDGWEETITNGQIIYTALYSRPTLKITCRPKSTTAYKTDVTVSLHGDFSCQGISFILDYGTILKTDPSADLISHMDLSAIESIADFNTNDGQLEYALVCGNGNITVKESVKLFTLVLDTASCQEGADYPVDILIEKLYIVVIDVIDGQSTLRKITPLVESSVITVEN